MNPEEEYLESFNNFINQLKIIFQDDDIQLILNNINLLSNEKKIYNGLLFVSLIDDDFFDLFVNSKIKLFSHKNQKSQEISESLFGIELCIKNILNNQSEQVKSVIWFKLHTIYSTIERTKSQDIQNENRLDIIDKIINKSKLPDDEIKYKLQEMLDVDVNNDTTDMLDDIIKSFENIINNSTGENPLSGIMEISQKISVKYSEKIKNGEIELDKLMSSITKKIPGMDKMMNGMTDSMGNIKDIIGGAMGNKEEPKEKVLIDENYSTLNVKVGEIEDKKSNFKIGNILKMADKFGILPGGKAEMPTMPNIGKVMELIQKLDKTSTPEDTESLKTEMNTFLQNDLGIDMVSFNQQMEDVSKQISENITDKKATSE